MREVFLCIKSLRFWINQLFNQSHDIEKDVLKKLIPNPQLHTFTSVSPIRNDTLDGVCPQWI